jgi:aryl-alcohol dehydrogenase-like predicted oxidoreductase/predicted kinase
MSWLDQSELRVGLGCMRLTDPETIAAALEAGITIFDTARAYEGNEALLARELRGAGARIVTKGGMGAGWIPDGRARTIRADCEASLDALGGLPIDLYLLHAPDPRTPLATSARALARLVDEGLVRRVGLANVNVSRLEEALVHAPVVAVQVALGPFDDSALRGGLVARCEELGIAVMAHSPLGGPKRAARLLRTASAEEALAWTLALSPVVVAIPGARNPEAARSAARAATLALEPDERERLTRAFGKARPERARTSSQDADLVLVVGIPGAGKSRLAEGYVARGYARLNRDERGGTLRELAGAFEELLASGERRVVLDNTYLTRASRSYAVDAAARFGLPLRCVWLDTPLAQAQVNLVERLLDKFGKLPSPEELKRLSRSEAGVMAPTSQMRALRELEQPSPDEGFAAVERVAFERAPAAAPRTGVFAAAAAVERVEWEPSDAPHLVFDWGDGAELPARAALLQARVAGPVEAMLCPHGGGPPTCWCRPPLPGLPLVFARAHGIDPARSVLVGVSRAHETLASTLGARYVPVSPR